MSVESVGSKQVYMLVGSGPRKHIERIDLDKVPVLERIKNVFGFGAINLGKIVDYCTKEQGKIRCDFTDHWEIGRFTSFCRNDNRMTDADTASKVLGKLILNKCKFKDQPELKEQVEYKIPYDIRGKLERAKVKEGEKPAPRKRRHDYKPDDKLPVKSAQDVAASRENEVRKAKAELNILCTKGIRIDRGWTQEEREDAIEAWNEQKGKLEAKIRYYENIGANLSKYNSEK